VQPIVKRILLISVVAALAAAGPAVAAPFKGVVVAKQHGVVLVAAPSGAVHAVAGNTAVGTRVSVSGTRISSIGRANRAVVRGVVVRRVGSTTFLSAAHRVFAVSSARRLASVGTSIQPGSVVQAQVSIDPNGTLVSQATTAVGQTGNVQIQATVKSVGTGTVTLDVNGQSLIVTLPAGLTLPSTVVGSTVQLNLSFAGGTMTGTASGVDEQGDNQNEQDDQGDENDDDQGSTTTATGTTTGINGKTTTTSSSGQGSGG
jgi:hypothetical protein